MNTKTKKWAAFGLSFLILISLFLIYYSYMKINDNNDKQTSYSDNTIKIRGDVNTIVISEKLIEDHNQAMPNYFTVFGQDNNINSSKQEIIAHKFLQNPIYNKMESTGKKYIYNDEFLNSKLVIEYGGIIKYYNDTNKIIPMSKLIKNNSLISNALSYINKTRGTSSDLKLGQISACYIYSGNSSTNTRKSLGYEYQRIEFNQYINGFKVAGSRGIIAFNIGEDGLIEYYKDTTVIEGKKSESVFKLDNLTAILSKISNVIITRGDSNSFEVTDCEIILQSEDRYSQDLKLCWELTLKSEDGSIIKYIVDN